MYTVSESYKQQINKTVRNISYIKVNVGIVEADASNNNVMSDNGSLFYSSLNDADTGKNIEKRYLTFEKNKFILDGNNLLPQESGTTAYYQGFVGSEVSDSNGNFINVPTITINFSVPFAFLGLTFRFNKMFKSYPSELQIIGYNGGVENYNAIVNPSDYDYIYGERVPTSGTCDKIELKFNKMTIPYRRAELEYIMFGIVKTFTDDDIINSTWTRNVDILSTRLPQNDFEFTILDPLREYNPENTTGIWQYLEERQPVWFQYGYELDNGEIEWISGSNLYTNGEIKINSQNSLSTVTFSANSFINSLDEIYYRGRYVPSGMSLYDWAIDVLTFANIPLLQGGVIPYHVDTVLQTIYTEVPIPELPIKECLQLIANAGMCTIDCDRIGRISITRFNPLHSGFKYSFTNMNNAPILNKIPYLISVETYNNTVIVSSTSTELHNSNVYFSNETECRLTYDASTEHAISVNGTLSIIGTPIFYAGSCIVTLIGNGDVIINGKTLTYKKDSIIYHNNTSGYVCSIENELLNSEVDTEAYATWIASIITRRNEYSIVDRGYPEIDIGDMVSLETLFSDSVEVTILEHKLRFNGTLSAETKVLGKDVN